MHKLAKLKVKNIFSSSQIPQCLIGKIFVYQISFIVSFLLIVLPMQVVAEKKSLKEVLQLAEESSHSLRSVKQTIKSIEAEIRARDLVLSSILSSELALIDDDRERVNNSETIDEGDVSRRQQGRYGQVDVMLIKPFETGTELSFRAGNTIRESGSLNRERNVADWEMRVSQSLWRNAFGRAVDLRHQAEAFELSSRRFAALTEQQQIFQNIENAYWDFVLAIKEIAIRESNLERSLALQKWTKDRVDRFAAENVDLLQVQTLVSERRLDLAAAVNARAIAVSRLKQLIPNTNPETWTPDLKSLETNRAPTELLLFGGNALLVEDPLRLEALSALYRAQHRRIEFARIDDELKPALDAYLAYGANGIDNQFDDSWGSTSEGDSDTTRVGILFSVELDDRLKNDRRNAARFSADAEESRARALTLDSKVGWQELQRNLLDLLGQEKEARILAALQQRKVEAERVRYEQGRSTTFQMTTFEVDASNSELRLYRLLAALRKIENTARSFTLEESSQR